MKKALEFLSENEIANVRKPLDEASMLPPQCYVNEDFFDLEKENVLKKNWLPVGHAGDIPEPGDYLTFELFDDSLVAIRQDDGSVKVVSNVCRHRGAKLLSSEKGKIKGDAFVCPYHAWTYNKSGGLVNAPGMHNSKGFETTKCKLPSLKVEIWHGIIFVNLSGDAQPLLPMLEALEPVIAPYDFANYVTERVQVMQCAWNWKATLENFSEAYHQPQVHTHSAEPWNPSKLVEYADNQGGPFAWFYMPGVANDDHVIGPPGFPSNPLLEGKYQNNGSVVINIFPLFHIIIDPTCAMILFWNIKGANSHEGIWHIAVPKQFFNTPEYEVGKKSALEFFDGFAKEDEDILLEVSKGLKSSLYKTEGFGRLCVEEKAVNQFHNWLLDEYLK